MTTGRWGACAGALLAGALAVGGCGDDDKTTAAAAPPPATSQGALRMEIQSVTLPDPAAATTGGPASVRPVVRFRVTDASGAPIDLAKEVANANASPPGIPNTVPRFTLAARDDRNDYRSYYATNATPKAYTVPDGVVAPPTSTQSQATYQPPAGAYPVGDLKDVGGGSWELTLPPVNQSGFDRTKTHTIAGWAVRSRGTSDADVAAASRDFVPSGGAPTSYATVTDTRCNQCHGFVQAHGTRRTVPLCITCHNPTTGDPETSRTVDFKVMIHKIHAGQTLPSAQQGKGYYIVGYRQTIADFSEVVFPYHDHGVRHCTVCHSGGAQSDNWKKVPTQAVCTSCHDNVQFSGSFDPCPVGTLATSSFKDCLHAGGPITVTDSRDPTSCLGCHGPGTAAAIEKYHHGD